MAFARFHRRPRSWPSALLPGLYGGLHWTTNGIEQL